MKTKILLVVMLLVVLCGCEQLQELLDPSLTDGYMTTYSTKSQSAGIASAGYGAMSIVNDGSIVIEKVEVTRDETKWESIHEDTPRLATMSNDKYKKIHPKKKKMTF